MAQKMPRARRNLITLSDGPDDGQRHYWTGGDSFTVFKRQNCWDREAVIIGRYERSAEDSSVFLFYPAG